MEAAWETLRVTALPFEVTNIAATYQDALRGKFADQVGDIHPLADHKRAARIADQITPYATDQTFRLKLSHTLIFF